MECSDDGRKYKIIALINACRIVDLKSSGINSCKAQHERAIGSVKISTQTKNTQLKELLQHLKSLKQ